MATRFLPMSWRSPLTVPRTIFPAFFLYPDADPRRKNEFEDMLLQGIGPDGPVEQGFRQELVGEIDRGGHQPPPFGPRNLIGRPPLVLPGQGPGPGIGGVPEIDPGNIGEHVRHLSPGGFYHSFFVGQFLSPLPLTLYIMIMRNSECGMRNKNPTPRLLIDS